MIGKNCKRKAKTHFFKVIQQPRIILLNYFSKIIVSVPTLDVKRKFAAEE